MEHCYSIFGFTSKKIRFSPLPIWSYYLNYSARVFTREILFTKLCSYFYSRRCDRRWIYHWNCGYFCNLLFWDRSLCHKSIVMNNYMNLGVTALLALINKIRKISSNKYNNVRIFFLCLAVNNYVFDDISSKKKRNVLKSCVTNVHSKKKTVKRAKNMNRMGWYNVL
jgi:hypothetical protein